VVEAGRPSTVAGHQLGRGGAPHGEILAGGASQLTGGVPHGRGWAGGARRQVGALFDQRVGRTRRSETVGAGAAGVGMCGRLSVLIFIGPPPTDRSYIIFRQLVLADGNYISSISFF
jgi:hypothetical protein